MTTIGTPSVPELGRVVAELRRWQHDDAPLQLHPGDVGWFWRFGAETTAGAIRTWQRDGRVVAIGLLDGARLLRLTTAPDMRGDEELARRLVDDVDDPARGVLPGGPADVEAPVGTRVADLLLEAGWADGEPWTPLHLDLAEPLPEPGLRIELVDGRNVETRAALQRASFDGSGFAARDWRTMAGGPPYADARCILGFDGAGDAVAMATVWSAGVGRPGLIEPLGVHRDHRGRGHGRAITLAAAAALRELGSSSAIVCTPTGNVGAVATYRAAGFRPGPERRDRSRLS